MNPEDPIIVKANVQKLIDKGAPEQDIHDYLEASGYPQTGASSVAPHNPTKLEIAKRNAAQPHPEDLEADDPSYAQQALGGIAALAHDIPGAEAAQAGVRSLARGQSYTDALSDIRGAEDSANPTLRRGMNILGGTIAAAATPGSNVALQGARFGTAEALGEADPATLKERIDAIPVRAGINALAGKVFGELVPNIGRVIAAKSLGKNVAERAGIIADANAVNYPKAKLEGDLAAANPTPAAVTNALNDPDIQPYVKTVRSSGLFAGANDATVLSEAYKLMGEKQRTLGSRIANSDDYKAGSELERNEIVAGKKKLLAASDQIMPSFRNAATTQAIGEGNLDALKSASDATKRIYKGGDVSGKNLEAKSPEAFMASILGAKQAEAQAMREGILGKLQKKSGLSANPLTLFGVPSALKRVNTLSPYIAAADQAAAPGATGLFKSRGSLRANMTPDNLSQILRAAGIGIGAGAEIAR